MKLIGRVIWRAAFAPPTWFAILSVFNSLLAVFRIWIGGRTVFGAAVIETMLSLSCVVITAFFWRYPVEFPDVLKRRVGQ